MKNNSIKKQLTRFAPLLSVLFWLLLWFLLALLFDQPLLLPTPMAVLKKMGELFVTGSFWLTVALSLSRVFTGILAALLLGTVLAFLTVRFSLLHHLFSPLLSLLKTTPVVSVIFLLLLFIGRSTVPLVIAFAMAMPIVWSNVREGLLATDRRLLEMASSFRVPRGRMIKSILLPSVVPYFLAACRAGVGIAFKAGIAAEVLAVPERSIGRAIYESKLYLLTDELFAYTLTVVVISAVIEYAVLSLLPQRGTQKGEKDIWSN